MLGLKVYMSIVSVLIILPFVSLGNPLGLGSLLGGTINPIVGKVLKPIGGTTSPRPNNAVFLERCVFDLGQKIIKNVISNSHEFYQSSGSPLLVPCMGLDFDLQYMVSSSSDHYLWLTDSDIPFANNGIQFELYLSEGDKMSTLYFGENIGVLGMMAFAQSGRYKIHLVSNNTGISLYIQDNFVARINPTENGYLKNFERRAKKLYLGSNKVGTEMGDIKVTCKGYDRACARLAAPQAVEGSNRFPTRPLIAISVGIP
ncbi:hypothetical protein AYI68_g7835 [Smittium mucronatum]|uniref:Uncharacterized protein n=1 Tax=Smittium mucronatum TaxID=133383 RepID=A0A1R0GMJ6_9FUNG|nr:hypothetical protein AYI68_g7835 [Smittium mucronatum]